MKIKQVSELCGLSIDTIRYYERIGLVKIDKGEYFKHYDMETVATLNAIKKLRFAGLTLAEIKKINSIDKDVTELSVTDVQTVTNIINRAIATADTRLKEITESKRLLEKINTKLQAVNGENC